MPENAVYVGRPTKWGNPYQVGRFGADTARDAVDQFRNFVIGNYSAFKDDIEELRGKDLACWCPLNQPCHADVLLELANHDP